MIHLHKVEQSFSTKETRLEPRPTGLQFKVLTAQSPCKLPHEIWGGGWGGGVKGEDMHLF